MTPRFLQMGRLAPRRWWNVVTASWLVGCSVFLLSISTRAEDPLDDIDGTEGWDQVVPAPGTSPTAPNNQDAFRREVADWESIRQLWESERGGYQMEKASHNSLSRTARASRAAQQLPQEAIGHDGSLSSDDGWGDADGEQWFVPSGNLDRVIEDELVETSRPTSTPSRSPAGHSATNPLPPPAPISPLMPPSTEESGSIPSAFRQPAAGKSTESGGISPTPGRIEDSAVSSSVPSAEDDGARAAAEMLAKQAEEQRRREVEEEERRRSEAEAGAAAAARLIQAQEEEMRREQEALRKKAKLQTDDEGQVVDPELQNEMNENSSKDEDGE